MECYLPGIAEVQTYRYPASRSAIGMLRLKEHTSEDFFKVTAFHCTSTRYVADPSELAMKASEPVGSSYDVIKSAAKHNKGADGQIAGTKEEDTEFSQLCRGMTLAVAYTANVGGAGTLTGTGTNVILKGHVDE